MTDYLLVHGAGQGAWVWGRVWGLLTAPEEHPPKLHRARKANRVFPLDLPGHGPDAEGDTAAVRLEEFAGRYTDLRDGGPNKMKGCCPLHKESTPSFQEEWHMN